MASSLPDVRPWLSIRGKLLLLYTTTLVGLVALGLMYYTAMSRWRHAAHELSDIHAQNERAEQLRSGLHRQVAWALDFLAGDSAAAGEIRRLRAPLSRRMDELESMAGRVGERDHLEGLRETWAELDHTIAGLVVSGRPSPSPSDLEPARARLADIASEVSEDIAVLNQFYRSEVEADILHAARAGRYAEVATGAAVVAAFLQLVFLVFVSQRWLVRPIAELGSAALRISTGDFGTRIRLASGEEWQHLARSINHMSSSLADLRQKLVSRERLAALGEAAAYTAHNIRNPLAAIRATAQVTRDELAASHPAAVESLSDIMHTVDRLEAWARRFLEFARPFELQPAATDVNELVTRAATLVARKHAGDPVRVETTLDSNLRAATVDALLLEQTVATLVTNALEAQSTCVRVATRRYDAAGAVRYVISVQDDGVGISEAQQERLFRAFVSEKPGGTGLGLAQSRIVVELHGGSLKLESAPGRGTVVTIDLPLKPPDLREHEPPAA